MKPDVLSRIDADIQWLTKDLGPRPAFSTEARLAALGIRDRLKDAGWSPEFVHTPNNLVACSGKGSVLLLAHSDTVPHSPGTLDNAVGVAALIEIARTHKGKDLCLGFPAQEELGLIGSTHLAQQIEKWHPDRSQLKLVIALDLVGHGNLSVTGLSTEWDHNAIHTLLDSTDVYSEYGYQVVSRLLPSMERSDHRSFAEIGYRSAHLLGRNEHGITPHYHLDTDTTYEAKSVDDLLETLETIIDTDWSNTKTNPLQASATIGSAILPWWLVWILIVSSIGLGFQRLYTNGIHVISTLLAVVSAIGLGAMASLPTLINVLPIDEHEIDSYRLYGLEPNGWWTGALFVIPIVLVASGFIQYKGWLRGNAVGWFGLCTLGLCIVDPILALPWAVGTLLSILHPLLGMTGTLYWLQADILRELTTHGLLPPTMWGLLGVLIFPALLSRGIKDSNSVSTSEQPSQ